jgi:CII-binding regulator of phage lambda lysogenization HflD
MENQQPILLNIQLNLDQINVILATMGKLPYETIAPLMDTIQVQATQQLQQLQQNQTEQSASSMAESGAPTDVVVQ